MLGPLVTYIFAVLLRRFYFSLLFYISLRSGSQIPNPYHRAKFCQNWPYEMSLSSIFTAWHYAKRGICRRHVSVHLSVCVCLYVTLLYCIKMAKRRITQITPHDSPLTLVFWHQSSWRNLTGINPYGGAKCRRGGWKFVTFDKNAL